jgi:hypothetical protein
MSESQVCDWSDSSQADGKEESDPIFLLSKDPFSSALLADPLQMNRVTCLVMPFVEERLKRCYATSDG